MDRVRSLFASRDYEAQENDGGATTRSSEASTPSSAERGAIAEALDATTLSWSTRIQGFLACFAIGVFIALLGAVMFSITWNLFTFGILYTLGNVVAIASTMFLMGPVKQVWKREKQSIYMYVSCDAINFCGLCSVHMCCMSKRSTIHNLRRDCLVV